SRALQRMGRRTVAQKTWQCDRVEHPGALPCPASTARCSVLMHATTAPAHASSRPDEAAPRTRRRISRPPAPLTALLVLVALVGVAWALVTPVFQAPDENSHFAYVQSLAERFALPGDEKRPTASAEQNVAASISNADQAAAQLPVRMEWSKA